jgi:hypothetical protein
MRDTIDMAREVDPVTKLLLDKKLPQGMNHDVFMWFLERFEALVRADEREACAKDFEAEADTWAAWPQAGAAKRIGAAAIRARGNT